MFDIGNYQEAYNPDELFRHLNQNKKAKIIAGGTDVLVKLRNRDPHFIGSDFIGIRNIPELHHIVLDDEETLCIGAATSFTAIANNEIVKQRTPLLAYAVNTVGGPQTRNAGTIGGNVCNGATSADSAPTLFNYNAIIEIASSQGVKNVPIGNFYLGPGKVDLQQGELVTKIKIKKQDYDEMIGHYIKFAQRKALDIANLSCAVLLRENNNIIEDIRISFGVAAPTPVRASIAEEFAKGKIINEENIRLIGEKCLASTKARNSWRASKEYRDHLIQILPGRNIKIALGGQ